jgi:hypothetical protein
MVQALFRSGHKYAGHGRVSYNRAISEVVALRDSFYILVLHHGNAWVSCFTLGTWRSYND